MIHCTVLFLSKANDKRPTQHSYMTRHTAPHGESTRTGRSSDPLLLEAARGEDLQTVRAVPRAQRTREGIRPAAGATRTAGACRDSDARSRPASSTGADGPRRRGRHRHRPDRGTAAHGPGTDFVSDRTTRIVIVNDPSAGSPTETLLRLLLPLNAQVWESFGTTVETRASKGPVQIPH